MLEREFVDEMELASRLANRLYLGKFLYGDVPSRMIQFMRRRPTFCHIMQDLFAGTQGYLDLKAQFDAVAERHVTRSADGVLLSVEWCPLRKHSFAVPFGS